MDFADLAKFLISALAVLVALSFLGNALPGESGSYVPPLIMEEFVYAHAIKETPRPCVALLGDSRVAFNISGAIIDRVLPANCRSQNYGFPGIGLDIIEWMTRDISPLFAIICASETMLSEPTQPLDFTSSFEARRLRFIRQMLRVRPIRSFYLGQSRISVFLQPMPLRSDGWDWSSSQKRWLYSGLEKRELVSLPSYRSETVAMAENYFANNKAGRSSDLSGLVLTLRNRGAVVALLIPPSETSFQQQPVSTGQPDRWQIVHQIGDDLHTPVIDCSIPESCGIRPSNFADPVHLNEAGAVSYSLFLASKIASMIAVDEHLHGHLGVGADRKQSGE